MFYPTLLQNVVVVLTENTQIFDNFELFVKSKLSEGLQFIKFRTLSFKTMSAAIWNKDEHSMGKF